MAELLLDNQVVPAAPSAGKVFVFSHTGTKSLVTRDDSGKFASLDGCIRNFNTVDVVANAADTYLTGSNITIPTGLALQVGTTFRWIFGCTKTAAGTAAPTWNVRVGTNGTTADASRLLFTGPAQTAAADAAFIEIVAILRNVGASGVLAGMFFLLHNLPGTEAAAATGFANTSTPVINTTSAGFDTTVAGTIIGVSVNPGAAGVWTHQVVSVEALGL